MIDSGFHDVLGQAKRLLALSPIPSIRSIEVESRQDGLAIRGCVNSFYLKQLAQETVRCATRGLEVVNEIQVLYKDV
jgi:hypothetical protein